VRQIVLDCGTEGAVAVEKIKGDQDPNFGFNASTEQYEDLVKVGFTVEVLTCRGLVTYYVLFFIEVGSRRVSLGGITCQLDSSLDGTSGAWCHYAGQRIPERLSLPAALLRPEVLPISGRHWRPALWSARQSRQEVQTSTPKRSAGFVPSKRNVCRS
jgi:hypothetical protein